MSSVIFQPLLHDPLGWKSSNSTYADHYQWKKQRLTRKDKILSTYGQQYQRQLQRQKENKQQLQRTHLSLPAAPNDEQSNQRVASVKKSDDRHESAKSAHRQPSAKSAPLACEAPSVSVSPQRQRSSATHREAATDSRASQRSTHSFVATSEETPQLAPAAEQRQSQREETHKKFVDANNDNSRHWLTYPNPKTPEHIVDSKVRLGQIKAPGLLARAKSALSSATEPIPKLNRSMDRTESTVVPSQPPKPKSSDERHFFDFNLPDTPDELRAARHRIEKHRYHASLDNYPPRPQTCPVLTNETQKPATPPADPNSEKEPVPNAQNTSANDTLSSDTEENKSLDNESSSVLVQILDMDGLPTEYAEALQMANAAQDEYMKELKLNGDKKSEHFVYRLPARSAEHKTDAFKAFRQPQQPVSMSTSNSLRQQDFSAWARQASDQERNTAMKILHDVLNQPVTNDDYPLSQHVSAAPRSRSGTRKLGRVRTQPRFPVDQEQQFVQNDLWNLTRSDGVISTHPIQSSKSAIIQI